jgi:hypothetical protein
MLRYAHEDTRSNGESHGFTSTGSGSIAKYIFLIKSKLQFVIIYEKYFFSKARVHNMIK